MARVLAISSQVVRGHVGLGALVPALTALGHEVWPLPTVLLSNHPGHRHVDGTRTDVETLTRLLTGIEANGWLGELDAVTTGYLPSAAHVTFAAEAIARLRAGRRDAIVLVDPILGDEPKGLYIAPAAAEAIRAKLIPMADIATPNAFELGWLCGKPVGSVEEARIALDVLVVPQGCATSVPCGGEIANVLVSGGRAWWCRVPRQDAAPHGTGDLFAGLYLGHLLNGAALPDALGRAAAGVAAALSASTGRDEFALTAIGQPWAHAPALPVTELLNAL